MVYVTVCAKRPRPVLTSFIRSFPGSRASSLRWRVCFSHSPRKGSLTFGAGRRRWIRLKQDAHNHDYMPPFPNEEQGKERDLCVAMERIGVMFRRKDDRVDMPDLFRVAARPSKKGAIAPR